jgi:hypothetical protein
LSGKEIKVAGSMVDVGEGTIPRMLDGKANVASTGTPSAKGDRIKQTRRPMIVVGYTPFTRAVQIGAGNFFRRFETGRMGVERADC